MRKNIFKAGAAVMAAAIVMMMPMTAKADGVVVGDGGPYPLVASAVWDGEGHKVGDLGNSWVYFENAGNAYTVYGTNEWASDFMTEYPAGYEGRGVWVSCGFDPNDPNMTNSVDFRGCYYNLNAEYSRDWEREETDGPYSKYRFTLDYNGKTYSDCVAYALFYGESGWGGYVFVVPKEYSGNLVLDIYGSKMENGQEVKDKSQCWTYYVQGSPAAPTAEQPAPAPQPTAEQPVPAPEITAEQPAPAPETIAEQPAPEVTEVVSIYPGTTYATKRGDNLSKLAKEAYGDMKLWRKIYEANKDLIKDPNLIWSNMQLMIP